MEVKDLSCNEAMTKRFSHTLVTKRMRGVIVGKSGRGKATLLLNRFL